MSTPTRVHPVVIAVGCVTLAYVVQLVLHPTATVGRTLGVLVAIHDLNALYEQAAVTLPRHLGAATAAALYSDPYLLLLIPIGLMLVGIGWLLLAPHKERPS